MQSHERTPHGAARQRGRAVVVNTTLFSRELIRGLELSASIYNLFDEHYSDPVSADFAQNSIPQDGRQFRIKATWKF